MNLFLALCLFLASLLCELSSGDGDFLLPPPELRASISVEAKSPAVSSVASPKLDGGRVAIVYVFIVSKRNGCDRGLAQYIKFSLQQAVLSQHNANVILVSNYKECPKVKNDADLIEGVIPVDTASIESERAQLFLNKSESMFQDDGLGNLWVTSALRFFYLEDMMKQMKIQELLHIEADNMLYGNLNDLITIFKKGYKGMAATPLNTNKTFMTASVLWIPSVAILSFFNDYLLALATDTKFEESHTKGLWLMYLDWLRPYACCKHGGVQQDANGMGLKPFAINEMSQMGYFHELYPQKFQLLPVVPQYPFNINRHIPNITEFGPHGKESGPPTFDGIWDPNSWGQFIGGTHDKNGRNKGFTDGSHIAGVGIRIAKCRPHMVCGNRTMHALPKNKVSKDQNTGHALECYTAPFVQCGDIEDNNQSPWVPLWNLHVHSKHTENYISVPCKCQD